jgi:hypothetical protein
LLTVGSTALLVSGCWMDGPAKNRADQRLINQVMVSKLEPGPGCRPLGPIVGRGSDSSEETATYEAAYEELRNSAALRQGNYVVIDSIEGPHMLTLQLYNNAYEIRGRAFECPVGLAGWSSLPASAGGPAAAASVPSAPVCQAALAEDVLDCGPGYREVSGACLPACNPACDDGEHCGADRVCHPGQAHE